MNTDLTTWPLDELIAWRDQLDGSIRTYLAPGTPKMRENLRAATEEIDRRASEGEKQ